MPRGCVVVGNNTPTRALHIGELCLVAHGSTAHTSTHLYTSSHTTPSHALHVQVEQAKAAGADIAELRLDYLEEFDPETDLQVLISESVLPVIITLRPTWEGYVGGRGWGDVSRVGAVAYVVFFFCVHIAHTIMRLHLPKHACTDSPAHTQHIHSPTRTHTNTYTHQCTHNPTPTHPCTVAILQDLKQCAWQC